MDTKKILSFIALLGGEAIIIAAFLLFRGSLATDILVLNIVVSSVIYGLLFLDILVPWVDLNDKSGKKVGSLGLRWFFTWLYAITAIAVMLIGNLAYEWTFALQFIIHCGLFFLLLLGFIAVIHSGNKVQEVYQQETFNRNGINEMKTAMRPEPTPTRCRHAATWCGYFAWYRVLFRGWPACPKRQAAPQPCRPPEPPGQNVQKRPRSTRPQ